MATATCRRLDDHNPRVAVVFGVALGLVVLGPALGPGHLFTLDMVTVPDPAVGTSWLGLGAEIPRATPFREILAIAAKVLPVWLAWQLAAVSAIALAYTGIFRLSEGAPVGARHAAAAIYAAGPFAATRLGVGHLSMVMAMGLLAWAAPTLFAPVDNYSRTLRWSVAMGLTGAFGGLLAGIAVAAGCVGYLVAEGRAQQLRSIARAGRALGCWMLGQLPWFVPGAIVLARADRIANASAFPAGISDPIDGLAVLAGRGFWQPALEVGSSTHDMVVALAGATLAVLAMAGRARCANWSRPASIVAAAAVALVWADSWNVTRPMVDALTDLPLGQVLREPQRFLALYLVWALPGAAIGIGRAARRVDVGFRPLVAIALPVAVVLLVGPSAWGADGRLFTTSYPASWAQVRNIVSAEPGPTVALPWARYLDLSVADYRRVVNPLPDYLPVDVIASGDLGLGPGGSERVDPRSDRVEALLPRISNGAHVSSDLAALGVRWVVLLRETTYDRYVLLFNDPGLRVALDEPEVALFEVSAWPGTTSAGARTRNHATGPLIQVFETQQPSTWYRNPEAGWMAGWNPAQHEVAGIVVSRDSRVWFAPGVGAVLANIITAASLVLTRRRSTRA